MKKFRVEVTTKGTFEVEIALIDTNKYDVDDIDSEAFEDILHGFDGFESEFIVTGGMGDDWDGTFELKVYDEDENVVYESEKFSDFSFINDIEFIDELSEQAKQNIEKKFEQDISQRKECGMYAVRADELKWYGFTFTVEDSEFNPDKLIFVEDEKLQGLIYDYMTGPDYVMYGDEFCEVECDEYYDDYGFTDAIYEMTKHGYFEHVKDIE